MGKTLSPLRYPGGKSQIYRRVRDLIVANGFNNRTYVEPFAGGFGVGIALLKNNIIRQAIINDLDIHIYHFWDAVLNQTEDLIELIRVTPITLEERLRQKEIYSDAESPPLLDGFSTLFLNRVNYSGVLFAGPLGGNNQASAYPVDCRFNKDNIIERIQTIEDIRDSIHMYHDDACTLIATLCAQHNNDLFFYIDPPYVLKGKSLYSEYYTEADHRNLERVIHESLQIVPWIVTYDDCDLVREIYQNYLIREYEMFHSAHNRAQGRELIITNIPENHFHWR